MSPKVQARRTTSPHSKNSRKRTRTSEHASQVEKPAAVEANAAPAAQAGDFDDSSPYQFPASDFAPKPGEGGPPPADVPPVAAPPAQKIVPPDGGAIRY